MVGLLLLTHTCGILQVLRSEMLASKNGAIWLVRNVQVNGRPVLGALELGDGLAPSGLMSGQPR